MKEQVDPGKQDATFQLQAEQSLLGCVLLQDDLILELADLSEQAFYRENHRRIWRAIRAVRERGLAADLVTVSEQLTAAGELEQIGGFSYLGDLGNSVPSVANVGSYAAVVREAWRRRTVRALLRAACNDAEDWQVPISDLGTKVTAAAMLLAGERQHGARVALPRAMDERLTELDAVRKGQRKPVIGSTTWPLLDSLTMPWDRGDLIQMTAIGTGKGKTSFATQVAFHAASEDERKVLYLSAEMSRHQIAERFLQQIAGLSTWRIQRRMVSETEFAILVDVKDAVRELRPGGIWVDDSIRTTADAVASVHRTLLEHRELHLVVLDYLQHLRDPRQPGQNKAEVLEDAALTLKQLAMDTGVVLLMISQTNGAQRAAQKGRGGDEDELDDTFGWAAGSRAVDNASDQIVVLHHGKKRAGRAVHPCKFHVVKHRGGPTGSVPLWWRPGMSRFQSQENEGEDGGGNG